MAVSWLFLFTNQNSHDTLCEFEKQKQLCNMASLDFFFPDAHPTGINSHLPALDMCHPELGTNGNEGSPL